jgi:hypothetical protein
MVVVDIAMMFVVRQRERQRQQEKQSDATHRHRSTGSDYGSVAGGCRNRFKQCRYRSQSCKCKRIIDERDCWTCKCWFVPYGRIPGST